MFRTHKILALIPARNGSKGLPGKNCRDFFGKPLIAWTIEAGLRSKYIDDVYVSTNCDDIKNVSLQHGAKVPFLRPEQLAADDSEMTAVIQHALEWITQSSNQIYDYLILLQPTSPLRTTIHIDEAIEYFFSKVQEDNQYCLVSASEVPSKYNWLLAADENSYAHFAMNIDHRELCRQKLNNLYLPNGAIYMSKTANFSGFYSHNIILYKMPEFDSVDIDFETDFSLAESRLAMKMC